MPRLSIVKKLSKAQSADGFLWKPNAHIDLPIEVAVPALHDVIDRYGGANPHMVLDAARPDDAPLHPAFEWDDTVASEAWRLSQARHLLNCVAYVVPSEHGPVVTRAFAVVTVTPREGNNPPERAYVRVEDAMARPDWSAEVLQEALSAFETLRDKYRDLQQLARIFRAIDETLPELRGQKVASA